MDYEDIDSVLKNRRERNDCSNSLSMNSAHGNTFNLVQQQQPMGLEVDMMRNDFSPAAYGYGSYEQRTDPPSTADALSVVYAQVNRGDKNNSRSASHQSSCNSYSDPESCYYEENSTDLYSVVRKESSNSGAGLDIYKGDNSFAVGCMSSGKVELSSDRDFYQFEKVVDSACLYGGTDDSPFNPYDEVDERYFSNRARCSSSGRGESSIYSFIQHDSWIDDRQTSKSMSLMGAICTRCQQGFRKDEEIVNSSGQTWHRKCFVCGQCFQQFPDGIFYEFEGRKYCQHDFNVLFAPYCGLCNEFIIGRVIKAMNISWHPECFSCQICNAPLADAGFIKNIGRALCRECNTKEKARGTGKYVCHKCQSIIDEGHIKYKGETYHPYHFNCNTCSVELNADAREKGGELYCLRCHDKMGIPICGACRRPIEERVVYALGKAWHVEHFVCAKCEKPFLGTHHYEKKGLAYCETHYHKLFGNMCFVCDCVVTGDAFTALNKTWCVNHFACSVCDRKMSQKTKFFEVDLKPVCKTCYEKFPSELKKRLKNTYDQQMKK